MYTIRTLCLFLFLVWTSPVRAEVDAGDHNMAALRTMFSAIHGEGNEAPSELLEDYRTSPSCSERGLAVAGLYRLFRKAHNNELIEAFSVHDYVERSEGKYNIITQQDVLETMKSIEYAAGGTSLRGLEFLLAYCHYRDRNEWFYVSDQKASAARFFRTAFFGAVFKGTRIDPVQVANRIDQTTEAQDLRK